MANQNVVTITDDDILGELSYPSRHYSIKKIRFWKIEGNFDFYKKNEKLFSSSRICCERKTDGQKEDIFVSGDVSGHAEKVESIDKIICDNAEIHFGEMTIRGQQVSFLGVKLEERRVAGNIVTFSVRYVVISEQDFCECKRGINEISIYTPQLLSFVCRHDTFKSLIDNSERALVVSSFPGQRRREPFYKEIVYPIASWGGTDFSFCVTNKISRGWEGTTLYKSVVTEAYIKLKFYDPISFLQAEDKIESVLAFLSIVFGEKELPIQIREALLRQEYVFSNNNQNNSFFYSGHDMLDWEVELRSFGNYFEKYLNDHIRCWDENQEYRNFVNDVYFNLLKENQSLNDVKNKIRDTVDSLKILHKRFCEKKRLKLRTHNKKTRNLPMWSENEPSVLKDLFDCFPMNFDETFRFKNQDKPIRLFFYSFLFIDDFDIEGQHKLLREIRALADQMRHPDEKIEGYRSVESKDDERLFVLSLL